MLCRFALLILAFLGLTLPVYAQSGLLLGGLSSREGYRTYWIVADGEKPRLAAILSDLIVPRSDGFWRVGVYEHSFRNRYESEGNMPGDRPRYFNDIEDKLYVVPVTQQPTLEVTADVPLSPVKSAKPIKKNRAAADENEACSIETISVTYLDEYNIGLKRRSQQTEFCAPGRYAAFGSNELLELERALEPSESIEPPGILKLDLLPEAERRKILKAVASDSDESDLNGITLTVARGRGNWVLLAWREGSIASRGGEDCELKIPASGTFSRQQRVSASLANQLGKIKGLRDYFVSPKGDLVVAIIQLRLMAYRIVDGKLSVPFDLAKLDSAETDRFVPVMAEWATGKFVTTWNRQMTALKLLPVKAKATKAGK